MKTQYMHEQCIKFCSNTKKLWDLINSIIKKKSNKLDVIESLSIHGVLEYDSQIIANKFGEFFSTVGKDYASKTPPSNQGIDYYIQKMPINDRNLYFYPTNRVELGNIINSLPNKNSSGYDDISNKLLKDLSGSILDALVDVFNSSMTEGVFPGQMKQADVVPLFKAKSKHIVDNYWPISLLLTISKLLEKLVYKRTYSYLEKYELLYKSQYGFRSKHSCEQAVGELVSEIIKQNENNKITLSVFLDLSKVFDTLDHSILLQKLERYGIRGIPLLWFKNYLTSRSLRAKVNTNNSQTHSQSYPIEYGTPQGSCLGPLLFLIFTNDLHLNINYCKCILFADDTTIYYSHNNPRYLEWCIQEDLKGLQDWFAANKLTLNLNKSVSMLFNKKKKKTAKIEITIDKQTLPVVTETKFLGVWLDSDLSWQTHCNKLVNKVLHNTHLLKLCNKVLNLETKRSVYFAHIYSHLSYGCILWGNMISKQNFKKLHKLQNKCISLINNGNSTDNDYKSLNILKVKDLVRLQNIKWGHKI